MISSFADGATENRRGPVRPAASAEG